MAKTIDDAFRDCLVLDFENDERCERILKKLQARIIEVLSTNEREAHADEIIARVRSYGTPRDDDPRRRYTQAQIEMAIRLACTATRPLARMEQRHAR